MVKKISSDSAMMLVNQDDIIENISSQLLILFDVNENELIGKKFYSFLDEIDPGQKGVLKVGQNYPENLNSYEHVLRKFEYKVHRFENSYRLIEFNIINNADEINPLCIDKKIFDYLEQVYFELDLNGNILQISSGYLQKLNIKQSEIIGKSLFNFLPKYERTKFYRNHGKVLAGEISEDIYKLLLPSGRRWVKVVSKLRISKSKNMVIYGIITDITESRQIQNEQKRTIKYLHIMKLLNGNLNKIHNEESLYEYMKKWLHGNIAYGIGILIKKDANQYKIVEIENFENNSEFLKKDLIRELNGTVDLYKLLDNKININSNDLKTIANKVLSFLNIKVTSVNKKKFWVCGTLMDSNENYTKQIYVYVNINGGLENKKIIHSLFDQCRITLSRINLTNKLLESEFRYFYLFKNNIVPGLFIDKDDLTILDCNFAAAVLFGIDRDKLIGRGIRDFYMLGENELRTFFTEAEDNVTNYKEIRQRTNTKVIEIAVYAGSLNLNGMSLVYNLLHDITEKKTIEQKIKNYQIYLEEEVASKKKEIERKNTELNIKIDELKQTKKGIQAQNNYLEILLNAVPVPLLLISKNKELIDLNAAAENCFNIRREQLKNINIKSKLNQEFERFQKQIVENIIADDGNNSLELVATCEKQGLRIFTVSKTPVYNSIRKMSGFLCAFADITEQKKAIQINAEALKKERELNEFKASFVSLVSHQFRTPIASILSFTEIITYYWERLDENKKNECVEAINDSVKILTEMLDSVLDINKIQDPGFSITMAKLEIRGFFNNIIKQFEYCQKEHPIRIIYNTRKRSLFTDEKLFSLAMTNLITNSIKYSPAGGNILIIIKSNEDILELRIKDEGIGIPQEDRENIFQPFFRGNNVGSIKGTGLGLAIIKNSIEKLGGRIELVSGEPKSTEFRILLKLL